MVMALDCAQAESPTRERNRARIVDAARRLWAADPDASMDDVALEAGVVRRTLYGHFAHRDDLVMAVTAKAADVLAGIAEQSDRRGGVASARLARLTLQIWGFAKDWRLVVVLAQQVDDAAVGRAVAPIDAAFFAAIVEGQRAEEFSRHLPAKIMVQVLQVQAMRLHLAAEDGSWSGGAEDAAVAALITAGVDRVAAAVVAASESASAAGEPGLT